MYLERDEEERKRFREEISKISPKNIIWVDEAGIDEIIYRPYARTDQGKRAYSDITGKRVSRTTIISGYCNGKLKSPMRFKGYTDKYVVNSWCEQLLSKELKAGDVVIMDNAKFHTYSNAKDIIAKCGAKLIFQPKYSPDLNKIEPQWANLKNAIRKNNNSKQNFFQKLDQQINRMMS